MRSRLNAVLLLIIVVALLTPGCAGTAGQDTNKANVTAGAASATNPSEDRYIDEFQQGFGHHTTASRLFNNATALWNNDSYADASDLLAQAEGEYARATEHYQNMAGYAGNDTERTFAENLENASIDMDEASSRYLMSINASQAGNGTAAAEYFGEGSALVDQGMWMLNCSTQTMPAGLDQS